MAEGESAAGVANEVGVAARREPEITGMAGEDTDDEVRVVEEVDVVVVWQVTGSCQPRRRVSIIISRSEEHGAR